MGDTHMYPLLAPGVESSPSSKRLPGPHEYPRVDDHLVAPEVSRDEVIGGRRYETMGSNPPHATRQVDLDYVLRAKVDASYTIAADLLTRVDHESNFASDAAILKPGVDPATGSRYLEEIAFEVVAEQGVKHVSDKAARMHARGVRRIFAIFLKQGRVAEWTPETHSWTRLDANAAIVNPVLVEPVEVRSLLDAAVADDAVASALITKDNRVLRRHQERALKQGQRQGRKQGVTAGLTTSILAVLQARRLKVDSAARDRILACTDQSQLELWLSRAAVARSVARLFEP